MEDMSAERYAGIDDFLLECYFKTKAHTLMDLGSVKTRTYTNKTEEWISKINTEPSDLNKLVLDYLAYEGLGNIAVEFARNTSIPFIMCSFLEHRTQIRDAIESGNIDLAITRMNDLNSEIVDSNIEIYYFLMEHKACEQAQAIREENENVDSKTFLLLEEVLEFVRSELSALVEENPALTTHLEDLLEFIVFNSRKEAVVERRRRLAEYINECILERYDVAENELKKVLNGIVGGEKLLTTKYKFPTFNESFM